MMTFGLIFLAVSAGLFLLGATTMQPIFFVPGAFGLGCSMIIMPIAVLVAWSSQ